MRRSDLGSQLFRFYSENPLWEIQQLFKGTRHDNRAQLVARRRKKLFYPRSCLHGHLEAWIWLFHPKHFKIGISSHFRTSNVQDLSGEQPCNMPL